MNVFQHINQPAGEILFALGAFYFSLFFGAYTVLSFASARNANQIALLSLCAEILKNNVSYILLSSSVYHGGG